MREFNTSVEKFLQPIAVPLSRISLFLVYFWFGVLKLIDASPANPLIAALLERTLSFVTFEQFIIFLGLGEMMLGILFLFPKLTKIAFVLLVVHLLTTAMPLVMVPEAAWVRPFVPTLEGQYMLKNLVLLSLGAMLAVRKIK